MAKRVKSIDESEIKALVAAEIQDAVLYQSSELDEERKRAIQYYNGEMVDTPAREGWSSFKSRDVADVIGWVLPGIIRVFSASDRMVDYQPREPGDEESMEQASDYGNYIFWNDNDGYRILWDATHDSLLTGDGIVKTWWDDTEECDYSVMSGLTAEQIALLKMEQGIEIVSSNEGEPILSQDEMGNPIEVPTYSIKIKRVISSGRIRIETIEPENFIKDKDSITIQDARFVAHRDPHMTRTKLVEMGFDKEIVANIPRYGSTFSSQQLLRNPSQVLSTGGDASMDRIELFECYLRVDVNNDGIAETVRAYYAGNGGAGELLDWEVSDDEVPFDQIPCEPVPHQFSSRSLAGEVMDIQQIKTVLFRQMLDNTYQVNNPRPDIEAGSVMNMDEVINPTVGGVVLRKAGSAPFNYAQVPPIMDVALGAIGAMDKVTEMRTGVSRATMALDPETLQNQTATASNNSRDAAYSQIELIARNQAELGWKKVFGKILRLIVKHQDRSRVIRLRDEWVEIDPRYWNANMDAEINVGLGTGSRDRDMAMLNNIVSSQIALTDRFAAGGMPDKALEMLPKVIKTFKKIAEAAGIKNADSFYPEVSDEDLAQMQQRMAEQAGQPDPKTMADMQKMQADMQMKNQELQLKAQQMQADMQLRREQMQMEADLKRYQIEAEIGLKERQLASELALKREMGAMSPSSSDVRMGGEPG